MRLFLEQLSTGKFDREEALLASHAETLGVPVLPSSTKQFQRDRVRLSQDDLFYGGVPFVLALLKSHHIPIPEHHPYPESLTSWLHRKVWYSPMLRDALRTPPTRVFIKPALGWKRFTGFVVEEPSPYQLACVSKRIPVWCSEPVNFVSEWRCYVAYGEVLSTRFADQGGDPTLRPDEDVIRDAVATYTASGEAPDGYVIDFGVLDSGDTALVEVNDGFSFGAYDGLGADILWTVAAARCRELLAQVERLDGF